MAELTRAVAYTRFSTDMQREESIEAQMRAIKDFIDKQGYALLKNYADRGISGTTDNRPEFQKMLDDAKKDFIEELVLKKLADRVFNEKLLPEIIEKYNEFALSKNSEFMTMQKEIKNKLSETEKGISNIVNIMVSTGSPALAEKLRELEETKATLEASLSDINRRISQMTISPDKIKTAFRKAKKLLQSGDLKNKKAIAQQYVKQVTVFKEKLIIEFNISDDYSITEEVILKEK